MTYITQRGIIHACDSNITWEKKYSKKKFTTESQKLLKIPNSQAYMTIAGSYSVSGVLMNRWMKLFLDNQTKTTSLRDLAHNLRDELQRKMLPSEKANSSIIHIAGYVKENDIWHPEFWFVRNATGIDERTGEYVIGKEFICGEEFWGINPEHENYKIIQSSPENAIYYFNGHVGGRIGINLLLEHLIKKENSFFKQMWNSPSLKFSPPRNIKDDIKIIQLYFSVINTLYEMSGYPARYIGGRPYLKYITCPTK